MIRSMTGYGRARDVRNGREITVEMRSVNHRYFECCFRLPRSASFLEETLKRRLREEIARGKVDVTVTLAVRETAGAGVSADRSLAGAYLSALRGLGRELNLRDDLSLSSLLRLDGLFSVAETEEDRERLAADVAVVADGALRELTAMRETEGAKLREDILARLLVLEDHLAFIEKRSPETAAEARERLTGTVRELLRDALPDENRILTETAILADRLSVDEETVRLRSHIAQCRAELDAREPVGRKLDFLAQELNREANTIASKCSDLSITKRVVEMKSGIEKIREQIQNIE